jgi:hypothetical protein
VGTGRKAGWLTIRSGKLTWSWTLHWCELSGGQISCYVDKPSDSSPNGADATRAPPASVLDFRDATFRAVEDGGSGSDRPHCFAVTPAGKSSEWMLQAEDAEQQSRWIFVLQTPEKAQPRHTLLENPELNKEDTFQPAETQGTQPETEPDALAKYRSQLVDMYATSSLTRCSISAGIPSTGYPARI